MEKENITYEVCPHCGEEVKLDAELKVQTCPNCGKHIVSCSMCLAKDDGVEKCCLSCPLEYLAHKMNEEDNRGIMDTTNGHDKHLVELLNKCWNNGPWDVRGLIMKSLYFRDYDACVNKGIFTLNDWPDWFKVDWDWEKYAYDYLMKVADDADLKAILYFLREKSRYREVIMTNKELFDAIFKDTELKKFVRSHTWISGSSTEVYPYALWDVDIPTIEIQLDIELKGRCGNYKFYAKDERKLQSIVDRYKEQYPIITDAHLVTNDGSCPPTLTFFLK